MFEVLEKSWLYNQGFLIVVYFWVPAPLWSHTCSMTLSILVKDSLFHNFIIPIYMLMLDTDVALHVDNPNGVVKLL